MVPWFSLVSNHGDVIVHPGSVINNPSGTLYVRAPDGTVSISGSHLNFNVDDVDYTNTLDHSVHSDVHCS